MSEFIAKYWIEVLFGLIVTGMSVALKRIWKLYKDAQKTRQNEERKELLKEMETKIEEQEIRMQKADQEIVKKIHNLESKIVTMTSGILSIQSDHFRRSCRLLLEPGHIITVDEFEQITHDHETYNKLGGNHIGDNLFAQVEKKFQSQVQ